MNLRLSLLACAGAASLLLAVGAGPASSTPAKPGPTVVHVYKPKVPAGKPVTGNCWTTSIATNRPDAFRCMNGNSISDPCFTTDNPDIVVCDPDPSMGKAGFAMRVKGPLPAGPRLKGAAMPWLVLLRDGTTCSPLTGTRDLVAGLIVGYGCEPAKGQPTDTYVGLGDTLDSKSATWFARRIAYRAGKNSPVLVSSTRAPIAAVWR
jgi:hypothetical protein